jgi:7-carboxy-7-deazaguanine synthase
MHSRQLNINECFLSVQGEGTQAGRVCFFVRTMGCPLRCGYCDTAYAFYEGKLRSFDDLIAEIRGSGCNLVELTGGEPLAQKNSAAFLHELDALGFETMIETSGAVSIAGLPQSTRVIMDVKTPGSGESARNHWDNMGLLKSGLDEVKFVICSRGDFDFAVQVAQTHRLFERVTVLVSPSWDELSPKDLAEWVIESRLPFRYQIQMHKVIWGKDVRGV